MTTLIRARHKFGSKVYEYHSIKNKLVHNLIAINYTVIRIITYCYNMQLKDT